MRLRRPLACLLLACLLGSAAPGALGNEAVDNPVPATHRAVAENERLRLHADPSTLSVVLEDRRGGGLLFGTVTDEDVRANPSWLGLMRSGFALEYFSDRSPTAQRVDALNGSPDIRFEEVEDGFDAHVSYAELGVSLTLSVRLTEDGLTASVPASSLREGEGVRLSALYLYPFMGATRLGEAAGYLLVPEGSGAIIDLSDNGGKYKTPYQKRVYGENLGTRKQVVSQPGKWAPREPVKILAPFFGIAHTQRRLAFLATIEQGQYNAEILAYPNGAITEYNWAAARFILREQYNMPTTRTKGILTSEKTPYFRDISLRFRMLSGEEADYSGMARAYRRHLLESGLVTPEHDAFRLRVDFLGGDTFKTLFGEAVSPVTTFAQARQIVADLQQAGLWELLVLFKGWQAGGLSKSLGSGGLEADSKLGGMEELHALAGDVAREGGLFYLEQDFLHANPERFYNTNRDIAKSVSQAVMYRLTHAAPFDRFYFLTPPRALELARRFLDRFGGVKDLGIAVEGLSSTLFSYVSGGRVHSRGEAAEGFQQAVGALKGPSLALRQPFDYLWAQADVLLDLPLATSNYNFLSAEVPFLPIALQGLLPYYAGYANFEPNNRAFFLKMVEYGAYPSFLITMDSPAALKNTNSQDVYSSQYQVYRQTMLDYGSRLGAFFAKVAGARMASHQILGPELVRTAYDNGLSVLINYGHLPAEWHGVEVPPLDYVFLNERGEAVP